ncbi:MAG: DNA topoisomerase VI subunit B [Asgard group archaeon]|nr:DNA topoisomerase VI subunit B [Asgard group archaeon]
MSKVQFKQLSPADFFYRNRELAGFDTAAKSLYTSLREIVENSFDGAEIGGINPDIFITIKQKPSFDDVYTIFVSDNGIGIPSKQIPEALAKLLFGGKYVERQSRGHFGLGASMTVLYSQITTNLPTRVVSAEQGSKYIDEYHLMIDIQKNEPIIRKHDKIPNKHNWHGVAVEVNIEGDYSRAHHRILDYLKSTALVSPYADITFVDAYGIMYKFDRVIQEVPDLGEAVLPHPKGIDTEKMLRLLRVAKQKTLQNFLESNFQRVGEVTSTNFLEFVDLPKNKNPQNLNHDEIVRLVQGMNDYDDFLSPETKCLSPIGEDVLIAGVKKELEPDFVSAVTRKPEAYSGHPFIVEVAFAYGGDKIEKQSEPTLYRYANRIPLLYDEYADVSAKVIRSFNWRLYKVPDSARLAVITHIASTKIPYRTAGKESIADREELEHEIKLAMQVCARKLRIYLSKIERKKRKARRHSVYEKYLPYIAQFATKLSGHKKEPDLENILEKKDEDNSS